MFGAIDHTGIAVANLDESIPFYRDTLGMPLVHRETLESQGVEAVLLDVGESHVELIAPLGPDTGVAKFLQKRGPGLHHVAYRVDDIDAMLVKSVGSRRAADRRAAARRDPRLARGIPASVGHGRGADRVGRARECQPPVTSEEHRDEQ